MPRRTDVTSQYRETHIHPATLGIPAMIIEADNDPLVEETLREQLKSTYPSAPVHTLHNTGHFPYLNHPDEYTRLLTEFFATSTPQ